MAIISDAIVVLPGGTQLSADCWGNNLAVLCPKCRERPVLLTARPGWRGSSAENPSVCGCGARIWMISPTAPGIPVHRVLIEFE
jgi:hypothetical protein